MRDAFDLDSFVFYSLLAASFLISWVIQDDIQRIGQLTLRFLSVFFIFEQTMCIYYYQCAFNRGIWSI